MSSRNEALGQAAVEYAAQLVVTERAAAKGRIAELEAALASAQAEVSFARFADGERKEREYKDKRAHERMRQFREDLKKAIKAPWWKRRGKLRDILDAVYWQLAD